MARTTITEGFEPSSGGTHGARFAEEERSLAEALFPLLYGLFDQTIAYARYVAEKRELMVAVWAVLYFAVAVVPAALIDLARLPAKAHDAWLSRTGGTGKKAAPARAAAEKRG